jgi:hypothetical protein
MDALESMDETTISEEKSSFLLEYWLASSVMVEGDSKCLSPEACGCELYFFSIVSNGKATAAAQVIVEISTPRDKQPNNPPNKPELFNDERSKTGDNTTIRSALTSSIEWN